MKKSRFGSWVGIGSRLVTPSLLALTALGCGDGESKQNKEYSLKTAPVDHSAEQARINRLQHVVLVDSDGQPVETGALLAYTEMQFNDPFTRLVDAHCRTLLGAEPTSNSACQYTTYRADYYACMARLFLAGTADEPGDITLTGALSSTSAPDTYHFGIQSIETSAALARAASSLYMRALRGIHGMLNGSDTAGSGCDMQDLTGEAVQTYAARFVQLVRDGQNALSIAQKYTLAAADKQLSSTSAADEGARRSIVGMDLSRAAAARLLVSRYVPGEPLELADIQAYCKSSTLSAQAASALALFRQVGIAPRDVLDEELSTASLVDYPLAGSGAGPGRYSLRQRLMAQGLMDPTSTKTVESDQHLDLQAFEEARRYLAEELVTFERDQRSIPLPPPPDWLGDGAQIRYANTSSMPSERSFAFYTAMLDSHPYDPSDNASDGWPRYAFDWFDMTWPENQGKVVPGFEVMGDPSRDGSSPLYAADLPSMAAYRASTTVAAKLLLRRFTDPASTRPGNHDERVSGTFAFAAQDPELEGILSICSDWETNEFDVYIWGGRHFGEARLLNYAADLECATAGTVEGVPCFAFDSRATLTPSGGYDFAVTRASALGYDGYDFIGALNAGHYGYPESVRPRMYVVVPKFPADPTRRGPGDWRAIAGFAAYLPPTGCAHPPPGGCAREWRCRDVPILPALGEQAKEIIAPSRESCGRPKQSCTGVEYDARMPLENELSDDNDGVESSWKYYLNLAEQAANEADQLGKEYLASSLAVTQFAYDEELRQRAQQEKAIGAMDRVQSICGTAIEPESLLEALDAAGSHTPGQTDFSGIVSPSPDCSGLAPGETCIASRRVRDIRQVIETDSKLGKLSECLGGVTSSAETTYGSVHLGTGALCAWQVDGKLCEGASAIGHECPYLAPTCTLPSGLGAGATVAVVNDGLGLFDSEATGGAPQNADACAAIRRLERRETVQGSFASDLNLLGRWKGLSKELLKRYAKAITYTIEPDDHIEVKLDNVKWISTRDTGPNDWPCGRQASYGTGCLPTDNATNHSGVFCGWYNCSSSLERSRFIETITGSIDKLRATTWENADPIPTGVRRGYYDRSTGGEAFGASDDAAQLSNCTQVTVGGSQVYRCKENGSSFFVRSNSGGANPEMATSAGPFSIGASALLTTGQRGVTRYLLPRPAYYVHATYDVVGRWADSNNVAQDPSSIFEYTWAGFDDSFDSSTYGSLANSFYMGPTSSSASVDLRRAVGMVKVNEDTVVASNGIARYYMLPRSAGQRAQFMGMAELVCEAQTLGRHVGGGCDPSEYAEITSLADADNAGRALECIGEAITRRAAMATFTEVPTSVSDPLRRQLGANVYNTSGGELAVQFGNLRMALAQVALAGPAVGQAVKSIGSDIRQLKISAKLAQLEEEMESVRFKATTWEHMTSCVKAAADATVTAANSAPSLGTAGAAAAIGAAAVCVNAVKQIDFAGQMRDIAGKTRDLQFESTIVDFQRKYDDHIYQFQTLSLELQKNLEAVSVALEQIHGLRLEAQRQISNALWYLSSPAGAEGVSNALRARSEYSLERYKRSTEAAKKLAFLAKRAIETRLGTPLREMRQEMPLVAAPSTWEASICATNGVDLESFDKLDLKGLGQMAEDSVLSYTKKLRNVVESYRLVNGFHEGTDTVVVSLRDDIHNVRIGCNVPSENLLKSPGAITAGPPGGAAGSWSAEGCNTASMPNCISVIPMSAIGALASGQDMSRKPVEHVLKFGTAALPTQSNPSPVPPGCASGTETRCGWTSAARLIQRVELEPGTYRFSWYGTRNVSNETSSTAIPVGGLSSTTPVTINGPGIVLGPDGNAVTVDRAWYQDFTSTAAAAYQRRAIVFTVTTPGLYQVGFSALASIHGQYQLRVAGPMLERVRAVAPILGDSPGAYEDGGDTGTVFRLACEDRDGSKFRTDEWRRNCEYVCPSGEKSDCKDSLVERCYWETNFYVSQRTIERGDSMTQSGFARGNYNYRIEEVGLNFIGTGIRDCSDSPTPSTCYSAAFVPYSLFQRGPFFVRNEQGIDYQFDLFPGRVEHARGLAAERYFTNPLSSTDAQLVSTYMRQELRGRPLDGNFTLRVWDEPGVRFKGIDDVQLVMKYRYWTLGD